MQKKYENWILDNGFDIPEIVQHNCEKICEMMVSEFPGELEVKCGKIIGLNNDKEIMKFHWWLFDPTQNEIVDPTHSQFNSLLNLKYEEMI